MVYAIVEKDNMEALVEAVQKMINNGWRPLGGVVIDRKHWYQAMVRN